MWTAATTATRSEQATACTPATSPGRSTTAPSPEQWPPRKRALDDQPGAPLQVEPAPAGLGIRLSRRPCRGKRMAQLAPICMATTHHAIDASARLAEGGPGRVELGRVHGLNVALLSSIAAGRKFGVRAVTANAASKSLLGGAAGIHQFAAARIMDRDACLCVVLD